MIFRMMKKSFLTLNLLFCLIHLSCGSSIPFQAETDLKRPVGLSVTAISGLKFQLSYFVQNQESSFIGYNLYIARNTIGDQEARADSTIPALNLDGTLPTFKHSSTDIDLNIPKTAEVSLYHDAVTNFEVGVTYFFRITACARNLSLSSQQESLPSNEVSVTATN